MASAHSKNVQHNLQVDGITCPFCVASSAKALRKIEGVSTVTADIDKGLIKVCADESADLNNDALATLFNTKGFIYRGKGTQTPCDQN